MQAIILKAFGGVENFALSDWPTPQPKSKEVRIKIKALSFNPVDYKQRHGKFGGDLPIILGGDVAGVVDAIGDDITDFKIGDEVYAYLIGPRSNGGYAEYVCINHNFVGKKPKNLSFEQATASMLVGLTAYEAVVLKAKLLKDETLFIAGAAGGVGSMVVQLAQHYGAKQIIASAGNQESIQYLSQELKLPENNIVSYRGKSEEELTQHIHSQYTQPITASFDLVGGMMKRIACNVLHFGGRMVSIVEEPDTFEFNIFSGRTSPLFSKSASFHFVFIGARGLFGTANEWAFYRHAIDALTQLLEGNYIAAPKTTVVGKFSADTVREAHRQLEGGHTHGKLVMMF
jgi:NADPH:quinone reductase